MTDEELIARLRDLGLNSPDIAADRIEQLVKERDATREAALREAAEALSELADHAVTALAYEHAHACRDEILELIGEKK
jgi:post-segregation antitoxin (ccd killing protein)